MAEGARVPIVVAYVDTASKVAGIDHVFYPTGDLDSDLAKIKAFYDKQKGLKPHNYASWDLLSYKPNELGLAIAD